MIPKKTKRANLERWKSTFMLIGLVIVLGLTHLAMESKRGNLNFSTIQSSKTLFGDEEIVPITRQELKPVEPPKPQQVIINLNIVDDHFKVDDNMNFDDFDVNPDDAIRIKDFIANSQKEENLEEETPFFIVESMPKFQGGDIDKFRQWVQEHLVYPPQALENQISGTVYITFVVEKNGTIDSKHIAILRGVDPLIDNEVIRVLLSAPKWEPGRQREKPARVNFSMPVKFILQ
jgi:protein TonB